MKPIGLNKDRDGKLITEPDKIRERWKEYIEQLYDKAGKPEEEEIAVERELSFLKIAKALRC